MMNNVLVYCEKVPQPSINSTENKFALACPFPGLIDAMTIYIKDPYIFRLSPESRGSVAKSAHYLVTLLFVVPVLLLVSRICYEHLFPFVFMPLLAMETLVSICLAFTLARLSTVQCPIYDCERK